MNFETNKILAERYLGAATHEDYVDWAVACLESDLDTKNIRILASLGKWSSSFEVDDYFNRCLKDLGLTMPDSGELLLEYARGIAQRILSGDISPLDGCRIFYRIGDDLGFPGEMISWLYLDEGLHPNRLEDLQGADLDDAIKSEAALLLKDNTALQRD